MTRQVAIAAYLVALVACGGGPTTPTQGRSSSGSSAIASQGTGTSSSDPAGTPSSDPQVQSQCSYTLSSPPTSTPAAGAASTTLQVTPQPGSACAWTAVSSESWITLAAASGSGAGTVNYSVAANSGAARNGHITVTWSGGTADVALAQAGAATGSGTSGSGSSGSGGTGSGGSGSGSGSQGCGYSVSADLLYSLGPLAPDFTWTETAHVTPQTAAVCSWTAVSSESWLTIVSGASGTGGGDISFAIPINPGPNTRIGTITVNWAGGFDKVTVTQLGTLAGYTITVSPEVVPVAGGDVDFTVVKMGPEPAPIIRVDTTGASYYRLKQTIGQWGDPSVTLRYSVDANTGSAERSTPIWLVWGAAGRLYMAWQRGASGCSYTTPQTYPVVPGAGGTFTAAMTSLGADACAWSAASSTNWITVNSPTGSGGAPVSFTIARNTSGVARQGQINIFWPGSGIGIGIYQGADQACGYQLTGYQSQYSLAAGGTYRADFITVPGSTCDWSASSEVAWMSIAGASSGNGSGSVFYTVAPNASATGRNGSIRISWLGGWTTVPMQQQGTQVGYTLSPAAQALPASGGAFSIVMTAADPTNIGFQYSVTTSASWLSLAGPTSGFQPTTLTYAAAANTSTTARTASITVSWLGGSAQVAISQAGAASP